MKSSFLFRNSRPYGHNSSIKFSTFNNNNNNKKFITRLFHANMIKSAKQLILKKILLRTGKNKK